jgi:hypothetical protein
MARRLHMPVPLMLARLRPIALALTAALALAYCASLLAPQGYVAKARVLLPGERMLKLEETAADPALAKERVRARLQRYAGGMVIDEPAVLPQRHGVTLPLSFAALIGLGVGFGVVATRERRRRPVRHERELVAALGMPLLAARPSGPQALRALCRQLLEHWFVGGRALLPIVGEADTARLAHELAVAFAEMGVRTLLIDADLRSARLHAFFGVPNRQGLADVLDGRGVQLAQRGENLALLVCGGVSEDPLELLSRPRLADLLRVVAKPFRVVLIATSAIERGPDFEIFAALAGGALIVTRSGEDAAALGALRARLRRCAARLVATVLDRR